MLDWSALLLTAPGALWLWTLAARVARRTRSSLAASPAQGTSEPKGEQPHRRPAAELLTVLTVKGGGVPTRIRRGRIALGSTHAAAALAPPAHGGASAREAVAVAEETAAQH